MSRDIQKQKVYDWEDSQSWMIKKSYLTQDECQKVITRLNKVYGKRVGLIFKNGNGMSWARTSWSGETIYIRNAWARSYGVLLHEYAHCLTDDYHGSKFVSEYCLLLHHLHPEQPSIKSLVKSLNDANVSFSDFEKTVSKKKLSKRHKPFADVCTSPLPVPVKIVKKRVSAKQRVHKILDEWGKFYDVNEYEYYSNKFVNINGNEYGCELWTWKEVENSLLEAIEQRLHEHEDYK